MMPGLTHGCQSTNFLNRSDSIIALFAQTLVVTKILGFFSKSLKRLYAFMGWKTRGLNHFEIWKGYRLS
jgi:hypothetical protein